MIYRTLRARFHHIELVLPALPLPRQVILVPNHHGWHDGYVMVALAKYLGRPILDWVADYDAFPLFGQIGGMRFPPDDPAARGATIRRTIRRMRAEDRSLLLFAESELHRGPEVLAFGKTLELMARAVPEAAVVPVGIAYELSMHERPVARVVVGDVVPPREYLSGRTRDAVVRLREEAHSSFGEPSEILLKGTYDINERMKPPAFFSRRQKSP